MAKKGTYGALRTQAPQVDFGEVARTVAGDFETKRQTLLKEKLLKSQQEVEQKRYTQKLREQSFKDTIAFSKEAKDMMNVDTSGMLNPVLTEILKTSINKYADMRREYAGADTGRRSELNFEMQRYKTISKNINSMSTGINSFFKDYGSLVNGKPKYSAFGSSKTVLGTIQAIKAASTQGLKKNADGSYDWGDRITIDNMGTPDMKLRITGTDGEELANNSMETITATLSSGLKPYNDISGAVEGIASKVSPSMRTGVSLDNTTLTYDKAVDVPKTMLNIRTRVDNYIGSDDTDIMKELRFNGTYGDTPDEIRKNMSKSIFKMQKQDHDIKISKDPTLQANIKREANQSASNKINNIIRGGEAVSKSLNNKIWNDTIVVTDDKEKSIEVSGAKITSTQRVGNFFVVKVNKDGKTGQKSYDLSRMPTRETVGMNIAQGLQGIAGQTKFDTNQAVVGANYGNIPVIEGKTGSNVATALDKVVLELAPLKAMDNDPSEEDMNAAIESIKKQAEKLNIAIDIDMSDFWGTSNEITITSPSGEEIKIDEADHKTAIDGMMNAISTVFNQPIGQPQTTDIVTGTTSRGGAY